MSEQKKDNRPPRNHDRILESFSKAVKEAADLNPNDIACWFVINNTAPLQLINGMLKIFGILNFTHEQIVLLAARLDLDPKCLPEIAKELKQHKHDGGAVILSLEATNARDVIIKLQKQLQNSEANVAKMAKELQNYKKASEKEAGDENEWDLVCRNEGSESSA